jgi:hypothetical protein
VFPLATVTVVTVTTVTVLCTSQLLSSAIGCSESSFLARFSTPPLLLLLLLLLLAAQVLLLLPLPLSMSSLRLDLSGVRAALVTLCLLHHAVQAAVAACTFAVVMQYIQYTTKAIA